MANLFKTSILNLVCTHSLVLYIYIKWVVVDDIGRHVLSSSTLDVIEPV